MIAHAKINIALIVGPVRPDGKHEVVTVIHRVAPADEVTLEPAAELAVEGFKGETIVRAALEALAAAAGVEPRWRARIEKRIPVAAGLGGGSSDAAAALRLANDTLDEPLTKARLHELAASLGSDVPFFLTPGPQLGTGNGSTMEPLDFPSDYVVCVLLPRGAAKESTAAVYDRFLGEAGFEERRQRLFEALAADDISALPPNDLASSPLAAELTSLGAFRADVSGAGPAIYGLFHDPEQARRAAAALEPIGRSWVGWPSW
jgi:4-diphosphocytidyl-2-C-methyl-D-erythritol kinase